jgi:PAS domain S-box-containing protein
MNNSTRDIVVENMDEGWMVVDKNGLIIDINRATEEMIGVTRQKVIGHPVQSILSEWPSMAKSTNGTKELELKRTVKSQNDWRYLNIRISALTDGNFGHLIAWRDVTKRKLAEDARLRARDELFVLLNAISSAASHTMNLDEFLSESIYQIIYTFNSQAVAIYLVDPNEPETSDYRLKLASHIGVETTDIKTITDPGVKLALMNWVNETKDQSPLIISKGTPNKEVPETISNLGFSQIAVIPMTVTIQQEVTPIGCLCLGRIEDEAYTPDEVMRLATIANQIAMLIDSDRRRQFAIALSERQRLLRDLHDSVSQKLYGLLTLTEAAQAAIEAGAEILPTEVLERIGNNARQAMREMRLFLYEMQPVNLDEGLVTVLHHRINAVEGRADTKARLINDENIRLPKEKEIALYYIAQEALNNILKHAGAKNVLVNLKQTRQNITLEITDDGAGFDMKKVDAGGLGMRTMRDRTAQIGGKFKITSKPGAGTKVLVTLSRKTQE